MKNNGCFAAVTFAMTIAGACVGYGLRADGQLVVLVTFTISLVGASAAYFSGYRD